MTGFDQSMYDYMIKRTSCLKETNKMLSFYGRNINRKTFIKDVDGFAAFLQSHNIKKGDNVVVCLGNIPNAIIAFYAVNRIGAIANVIHPLIKDNALKEIIDEMHPSCYIMFDEFYNSYSCLQNIKELVVLCSAVDYLPKLYVPFYLMYIFNKINKIKYSENVIKYSKIRAVGVFNPVKIKGDDIAIYMHSGGTTGKSKTACLSNAAYNHLADNLIQTVLKKNNLDDKCGMLMALPIFHTFGLGVCMHTTLCFGAQVVMMPKFNADYAAILMRLTPIKMISGVPNMYRKMADSPLFKGPHLKKLTECFCGGDKLPAQVRDKFEGICRKYGNQMRIAEGFGLTEAGICILNTQDNYVKDSIGEAVFGNRFEIMNEEHNVLDVNMPGVIYISSSSAMTKYYNDVEATNNAIYIDGNGIKWINTGDIGYKDESGHLFFTDRLKRLIKISGNNVFPQEIENVVNGINEIEVSCAKQIMIGKKPAVKLFVKMKEGYQYNEEVENEIKDKISKKLLKYCIPSVIEPVEKMPLTSIGKVDFNKLN